MDTIIGNHTICTSECYFKFKENYYKEKLGFTMGRSLVVVYYNLSGVYSHLALKQRFLSNHEVTHRSVQYFGG